MTDKSELRSTIAGLSAECTHLRKHQKHREKIWKHRVTELKARLELTPESAGHDGIYARMKRSGCKISGLRNWNVH